MPRGFALGASLWRFSTDVRLGTHVNTRFSLHRAPYVGRFTQSLSLSLLAGWVNRMSVLSFADSLIGAISEAIGRSDTQATLEPNT